MNKTANQPGLKEFSGPCYVLLHIGRGPTELQSADGFRLIASDGERFQLGEDIWIERLDESIAKNVQQACEPPHYKIAKEIWDRHLYAFVIEGPNQKRNQHECLEALQAAVSLSRLANPTSTGDRYCAQIMHYGMKDSAILAIEFKGASQDVTLGPNDRDWLSHADAENLLKLMPWIKKDKKMLPRVHRAYWNHEYAMRTRYIDLRWTIVISGIEALINTGAHKDASNKVFDNKAKFWKRTQKLASHFNISMTEAELKSAYDMRSKLVHAESFLFGLEGILPRIEHSPLYEKLEQVLRSVVRKALLDEDFGNSFKDDASVSSTWNP